MDLSVMALPCLLAIGCSSGASPGTSAPADASAPASGSDADLFVVVDAGPPAEDSGVRRLSESRIGYTARLVMIEGAELDCEEAGAGNVVFQGVQRENGRMFTYNSGCLVPATTELLAPGTYDVTFTLYDRMMQLLSTAKGTYVIGERAGVDVEVVFPIQSFKVTWTIGRNTAGGRAALTCQEAGAGFVDLTTLMAGDSVAGHYSGECSRGPLTTAAVPLGRYTVEAKLLDANARVLATSGPQEMDVTADKRATVPVDFTLP